MKKVILLVDDDLQMLEELSEIFKHNGYKLLVADSGKKALEISEIEEFDMGIIDMKLADYNGVDLIEKLKRRQPNSIYLIITAYASVATALEALHKGVFDYIAKPFEPEELLTAVNNGLNAKQAKESNKRMREEPGKES